MATAQTSRSRISSDCRVANRERLSSNTARNNQTASLAPVLHPGGRFNEILRLARVPPAPNQEPRMRKLE